MKTLKLHQIATLALALLFGATAMAAQTTTTFSTTSPYATDPQHEYVHDATSEAIGTVNMVLCIVNAMNISDSGMLNVGPYIALIDMNKCESHGKSGNSADASASVNYMTAVVDATRASATAPMIANVWMSMTEEGRNQTIYVKLTATTPPSSTLPYGVFRLDFLGEDDAGVMQMNGYIDSSTGSLQYFETGPNSSNVALNMAASSTDAGNGVMTLGASNWNPTPFTYNFNYNANYFRRSDGANDQCFDRAKVNTKRSVWRYGTYTDTSAGTRVDQASPSFQLSGTFGGDSFYGHASYWGIGFQGLDLNGTAITSATSSTTGLISGLVATDQRPGHTTETYSVSKVGGKLTKWTQNTTPLSAMDGIPINFWGNLDAYTSPALTSGFQNWQLQWDNTAGNFKVLGTQSCGSTGCSLSALATATVTNAAYDSIPISGWSDSFGGNINIPSAATRDGNTQVSYFSQSIVTPGSTPLTLHCLSRCPDATSVGAVNAYASSTAPSPYKAITENQWFSTPDIANTVDYTFDGGGLKHGSTAMVISNANFFDPDINTNSSYIYGVQSGRLFVTAFDNASCTGSPVGTVCEPSNPAEYYTWTTGTDQWNQSLWLTRTNGANSGEIVAFDPPLNAQYSVPNTPTIYGGLAGKTIQLQFNGFGNLYGIPGHCVSPVDNSVVDCNTPNVRYVPAFSIPDGETMTLNTTPTATQLVVKALDSELRLNDLGVVGTDTAATTACGGLSLTTALAPPTGGTHDVSPGGAYYIGAKPTVTTPPKVIDGVVQY